MMNTATKVATPERFPWIELVRLDGSTGRLDQPPGEINRLREVFGFVCGRLGAGPWTDAILSLTDTKGNLEVQSTRGLREHEKKAFREAWGEMGGETLENVEFISREDDNGPSEFPECFASMEEQRLHFQAYPEDCSSN